MKIKAGDKVKYSAAFLRSVGMYTGPFPHATGEVLEIQALSSATALARIKWDSPDIPERVNVKNLTLKNRLHLEA